MQFKESLKFGNPDSCIAICTLWTQKARILSSVRDENFFLCGNLYSIQGISYMLKSILENPQIRYIVLCGKDMGFAGEALANFFENGIDESWKIIGSYGKIDKCIPKEAIEKIRNNVKLIDMRNKENEINEIISSLPKLPPFSHNFEIDEIQNEAGTVLSDNNCFLVKENTIAQAWLKILDIIMKFGEEKPTEYGQKQKEILNFIITIDSNMNTITPWLRFSDNDLAKYYPTILSGEKPADISYTYGERLFRHPMVNINEEWKKEVQSTFDQVENAVKHLKEKPYTRRAIAFTWNVALDSQSENPPCLTQVSWNIKNDRLCQTVIFRSNDMFGAWPMNAFALKELQKNVAEKTGKKCGDLTYIVNSAHIYETDWRSCFDLLARYYSGGKVDLELDRNGYFLIYTEREGIIVQFCQADGRKTPFLFKGTSAIDLYRRILHENLVQKLDHAAYLGSELTRAEDCWKSGKEYAQE